MISDEKLLEVYNLKNIIRYSTRPKISNESVAEHSFYVALFALMICDELNLGGKIREKCLIKAILHDMPEVELNDITHDVKVKLNLYQYLESYEKVYFGQHFPKHIKLMNFKKDTLEQAIVDYADVLSVKQYVLNEKRLGNQSDEIEEIFDDASLRLDACRQKLYKLLEEQK